MASAKKAAKKAAPKKAAKRAASKKSVGGQALGRRFTGGHGGMGKTGKKHSDE